MDRLAEIRLPDLLTTVVRIQRVHAVVHGRSVDDVVAALAGDRDIRDVEGLCIDLAVQRRAVELAELRRIYIRGRQDSFVEIGAGSQIVVVLGSYADLGERCMCCKGGGERREGLAMHRARTPCAGVRIAVHPARQKGRNLLKFR
jgi:hypothetical protein